jgi:hypothetical protein
METRARGGCARAVFQFQFMGDRMTFPTQCTASWFAVAWSVFAYIVLLRLPSYSTASSSSAESVVYRHASLTDINGPRVLPVVAIPAIAAIVGVLPWPASARQPTRIVSAVVATLFALLSAMTVGSFFLPTGIALIIAAWAGRTDRPPATGTRKS